MTSAATEDLPSGPIFLIGFMGVGKTTVGQILAEQLGRPFLDLDALIVARTRQTVSALFAARGEAGFRACEAAALREAAATNAVVAAGGGAPAFRDNLAVMRAAGPVLLLRADPETLLERLGTPEGLLTRPLLADAARGGRLAELIADLCASRAASYAQADHVIDTRDKTAQEVAERAHAILRGWPGDSAAPKADCAERITVDGPVPYPVVIDSGPGAELRLGAAISAALPSVRRLAVLTDENVARLHHARLTAPLRAAGLTLVDVVVPAGEGSKRLAMVEHISSQFLSGALDRRAALLAIGGGVVSDLGGFVAATLLRGIPWAVAPTTLLSQVDAAIGGKTAVNLPQGKNLIGAFHHPRLVYADLSTLDTLPPREFAAGLGEVLKHALLLGDDVLGLLEERAEAARSGDRGLLHLLIGRSCRYKAEIVAKDPEERDAAGGRALLNLGHTIGHALETASTGSDDPLFHGEAVALGLLGAARVSARLVPEAVDLEDRLGRLLPRLGLPADLDRRLFGPDGAFVGAVSAALGFDKKRADNEIRFVTLVRPGLARLAPLSLPRLLQLLRPADRVRIQQEDPR